MNESVQSLTQTHDYSGKQEAHAQLEKQTTSLVTVIDASKSARRNKFKVLAYAQRGSGESNGGTNDKLGRFIRRLSTRMILREGRLN